jgi:hypothetical protein
MGVMLLSPSGQKYQAVRITTEGSSFNPTVELASGSTATVKWQCEETGQIETGINPTLTFGSSATRHVRMTVSDAYGDAMRDIVTFNMGFSNSDDTGIYQMGAGYNKTAQSISGIENARAMTGLVRFAAANISSLVGPIDLTGLSSLQFIECFYSRIQSIILSGCTSLIRLCLEHNNISSLDLNPVAACLKDFRGAEQVGGTLTLVPVCLDLGLLYHLCCRNETLVNHPQSSRLPLLEEQWVWSSGRSGTYTTDSSVIRSMLIYNNYYTAISLANKILAGRNATLDANHNRLTSVDISGCPGLTSINLSANPLLETTIDTILNDIDAWSTSGGTLNLGATCGVRSAASDTAVSNLAGRGWTVYVDAAGVASDDFERADATGLSNVGNGWYTPTDANANIVSGDLVRSDTGPYYRIILNHGGGALAANYSVTATVPGSMVDSNNFGLVGRWNGYNGVRLLFRNNSTDLKIGDASDYEINNVNVGTPSFPASWSNNAIDHTITMHMSGTTITIEIDGSTVCTATVSTNATATNTSYGICGTGNGNTYKSIGTTTP